jgi:hypothetical protein
MKMISTHDEKFSVVVSSISFNSFRIQTAILSYMLTNSTVKSYIHKHMYISAHQISQILTRVIPCMMNELTQPISCSI